MRGDVIGRHQNRTTSFQTVCLASVKSPTRKVERELSHPTTTEVFMVNDEHPIGVPPEDLVLQWDRDWHRSKVKPDEYSIYIATKGAQWGADRELEACCAIALTDPCCGTKFQRKVLTGNIRIRRRPKPPSLKEQALRAAQIELDPNGKNGALIIRALESLPE